MVPLVNSHTNATSKRWQMWQIDLRFALNSTPEWLPTRWATEVSFPLKSAGYVTKFTPHQALELIARGKLTLDARAVLRRVAHQPSER